MYVLYFLGMVLALLFCEVKATANLSWTKNRKENVWVGDQVSINCTTIGPGILVWAIEPFFGFQDRIVIAVDSDSIDNPIPDVIIVIVASSEQDSSNSQTGNLTSVITIKVTDNNIGRHVHCSDGRVSLEDSPSLVIPSGSLPSVPVQTPVNVTYKIAEYFAVLKWFSPSDDGPEVTNYTITLQDENDVIYSETVSYDVLEYPLYLNYSTNYSVSVFATNCKGTSRSTYQTIFKAGCSVPVGPVNGRVGDYESTEEGAEIRVYCFDKLSENVLRCLNSSWYPDPAELDCISPAPATVATCPPPNTGTSSSVSPSSSTFATTSDDGPDSSREEDPQQMTVILTSVIATLVMVTLLTCTVMIVALVFCYRANIRLKRDTENLSSSHGNERLPPVYDEILSEKELAIELCNIEAYGHISH